MEQFKRELKLMATKEIEAKALIEETIASEYHPHCFEALSTEVKNQCSSSIAKLALMMKKEVKAIISLQMEAEKLELVLTGEESLEELQLLVDAKLAEIAEEVLAEEV